MRTVSFIVVLTVLLAVLAINAGRVSAQPQPSQYGGGYLHGQVLGFNYDNYLVPIAWGKVVATNGFTSFAASTGGDGGYGMFVPPGIYNVTALEPGYVPYTTVVAVSDGSSNAINFYLEQSKIPVPEFPSEALPVILIIALAATLLLKKRITQASRAKFP